MEEKIRTIYLRLYPNKRMESWVETKSKKVPVWYVHFTNNSRVDEPDAIENLNLYICIRPKGKQIEKETPNKFNKHGNIWEIELRYE